ncbi:DUF2508 family protein [Lacticaseibacillus thailandensis]|uniref:Uncharacterized protein n=1 Tax=Lacticaseibacillus thailandensis DSM 22698 = JCM 13996 TaxID=1423810 RepID=A0A0R2C588_9LACO|nr:DUF2508 family protein [Lacticaseibacillus thailandensis]KRM86798.1 hypothetical protein FD19_GL001654 [Lacticaseibacillus thailandensis DSM 22698 = JCM 13996]
MFGRKKTSAKLQHDAELLELIYAVRDQSARAHKILNNSTEGATDLRQQAQVELQEGLFDFLHRQARTRKVSGQQVEDFSVRYNLERKQLR